MGIKRGLATASCVVALSAVLTGCEPAPSPWGSALMSIDATSSEAAGGMSYGASFSGDGTKVAFFSLASNFGPTDSTRPPFLMNGDVYVRDLVGGLTTLVSVDVGGSDSGNAGSSNAVMSADGTKVAFDSGATNFGPADADPASNDDRYGDVYVRDLVTGTTTLVSVNATGTDSGTGRSWNPVFSPDGTKVAFESHAADLGANDTNSFSDVYVRDLIAGTTTLVSVDGEGLASAAGQSSEASFSPDGSKVVFHSSASTFGPLDTNAASDVYLRDLATSVTSLVSVDATGDDSAAGSSFYPVFSPDGTRIAFMSDANNFGVRDDPRPGQFADRDIYVRDLATSTSMLVSANRAGTNSGNHSSRDPVFSPDGTKVAFMSNATNLVASDANGAWDLFLRDLTTSTTSLVSTNAEGTDSANDSAMGLVPLGARRRNRSAEFSPDGSKVAFLTAASDLGPRDDVERDDGVRFDVYVRDLSTGTATLVSANSEGTNSANGGSYDIVYSPAGDSVLFTSVASDLGSMDTNTTYDLYLATLHGADLSTSVQVAPEPVTAGGELTYDVDLTNRGPDEAQAATAAFLLPEGTELAGVESDSGPCAPPTAELPRLVTCSFGDVPEGDLIHVTVTATVTSSAGPVLRAVAAFSSSTLDPTPTNNTRTVDSSVT